jgi:hypothetical protein
MSEDVARMFCLETHSDECSTSHCTGGVTTMARRSTTQRSRNPLPVPDKMSVAMIVNGVETQLEVAPWTTLLDTLRDHLDLTGL